MTTKTYKIELETVSLLLLGAIIAIFFTLSKNNFKPNFETFTAVSSLVQPPIPTIAPAPKTSVISQVSSDGTKKLIMKMLVNKDYSQTYTFYSSNADSSNQQFIFQQTVAPTESISIPFNTWSPDNNYFFILKNSPEKNEALVFNSSGKPFSTTESYYNATDIFNARNTGYVFNEATGWASETLIIINTKTKDGAKGASFWFEVPTKAIIQLSTEF